jgi:hypothetical protein
MIPCTNRPTLSAWRHVIVLGHVLLLSLVSAAQAQAQGDVNALVGLVFDRLADRPAVGAEVVVPALNRYALTDEDGWFVLNDVPSGEYTVEVRYLGLTSSQFEVDLHDGITRVDFEIATPPFELEELIVEVRQYKTRKMIGFERRRERASAGAGYFYGREEIEEQSPIFVSDLLRRVPGLRIDWNWEGNVELTFGHGLNACEPDFYVDGSQSHAGRINDFLPNLIEAIEIYSRPMSRPEQFKSSACGAILIWTRETM